MKKIVASTAEDATPTTGRRRFDRTELIIDTAADMFKRKGYTATSLQDIASAVGLLKGSIYHYIDSKEDILFAIIKRNHDRIIDNNLKWKQVDDPLEAIDSFIRGHILHTLSNTTDSEVYLREFRSLSSERAESITKAQDAYDHQFRDLVKQAIRQGLLRPGVTPEFAARAVFGMANWTLYWYNAKGTLSTSDVVEELSSYAMASLLTPEIRVGTEKGA